MIKIIPQILLLLTLTMIGCANPIQMKLDDIRNTVNDLRPKAEAGSMKWSEYYKILVDKMKELPPTLNNRDADIQSFNYGVELAKKYEAGEITKEEFYKWRMEATANSKERVEKFNKIKAECEYESVSRANPNSSVEYAGNNINRKMSSAITGGYEIAMRQNEIFALCMKSKGIGN